MTSEDTDPPETPLDELQQVASELNRAPSMREFTDRARFNASSLLSQFGDWEAVLRAAGVTTDEGSTESPAVDEQELVAEICALNEIVSHVPTKDEFSEKSQYHVSTVIREFGSWEAALRAAGINKRSSHSQRTSGGGRDLMYTKEDIINEIQTAANELDRPPLAEEFQERDGPSLPTVYKWFDTWEDAIKTAGLDTEKIQPGPYHSDDELIAKVREVANELGHPPRTTEFNECAEGYNATTCTERFGSWDATLQQADLDPNQKPDKRSEHPLYSRNELLEELKRVADLVERPPLSTEFYEHTEIAPGTLSNRFGDWNQALEAAGLDPDEKPEHPRYTSRDEVLSAIHDVADEIGYPPRTREFNEQSDLNSSTPINYFGDWQSALNAAGLDPDEKPDDRTN